MSERDEAFYTRTAEMVTVLLPHAWTGLAPATVAALAGAEGPVVDVGAGTGEGVRAAAEALPGVELVAVEPNPALRTALLAVVAGDPDLRARVTVQDSDIAGARLPDRIGVVLLMNVLGHFDAAGRGRLWDLLAERLLPAGRALLTLYPPTTPQHVPTTPLAETVLGRRRYQGSAGAEPAGADALEWEMSYRIVEDGACVAELTARSHWFVVGPERIAEELRPRGLTINEADPGQFLYVVSRSPSAGTQRSTTESAASGRP